METTYIEKTSAKALGTYSRAYSIFKTKHLRANIKLIVYTALIKSIITYACPTWEFDETAASTEQSSPLYWQS
jgi:hypothetical protein